MEKGAKREGKTPDEIAQKYIDIFETDTKALNLLEPTFKPRATEYIGQMIDMISTLLEKGFAYTTDLAVYFDVTKFSTYTGLSHQQMDKQQEGAGKADVSDPRKIHAADFALWFFKAGVHAGAIQYWKSPFQSLLVRDGVGFPGWHIECSAMSKALLGNTLDIHLGGVEHIPVHHTNEIAQSEAANGVKFVNYWLHNEHLLVDDKKMAKSEGTGFSLQEVMDHGYDPLVLRYFFLQAHYRSKQNFTWEALDGAKKALNLLRGFVASWKSGVRSDDKINAKAGEYKKRFADAVSDDVNVPKSLAVVWEMTKADIPDAEKLSLLLDFDRVLGLGLDDWKQEEIPVNILQLVDKRNALRKEKKFSESDIIRKQIEHLGYVIEDAADGVRVKKA
jgi:cysteinyl-tRNA synthetase